ncbi:transposase [Cereibacter azotoformans]|uniref:Transposase and inactivated derivatives-like protein n=1 Tax=Cereibacter sphaeroides (strain ATCC 17025 / ATH 2.4.3) TaxID=349102 RepID=A4WYE4_CERS5|nr:exonuclease domain-containing protein [Cereibacter azotoformans]ULB11869.1 transposase [Cereibacter azotoformans]
MKFVVLDVETANPRMSSICQIGLVTFEGGVEVAAESHLIDPEDHFDPVNVAIHGITAAAVVGEPTFREVYGRVCDLTAGTVVACHTHFDRVALSRVCELHALPTLSCSWLDTARVARRAWVEFSKSGYGLSNLARHFGITFQHHDALHDARAAGLILARAIEETGHDPSEWIRLCNQATRQDRQTLRRDGDGDGPLVGESIVFTGALQVPRREAADLAHQAGAAVEPNVTKGTTILVVGDQDIDKLAGHDKSSKHRKAEALIEAGQSLRILGEADFMRVCAS